MINNFNYARFLPESIESALAQTYPEIEVVVVDDASTDDSVEVIRGFAERVVPVLKQRNEGQGAAINAGFGACRGAVVMLLDADDYLYPQAAERVAEVWSEGLSKVQYRLDLVDAAGAKIDVYPPPEVSFDSGDVVPQLLTRGRYETTVTSGNAFSRAALEKILPIPVADFRISADGYLSTVAPFHGLVASIEQSLGAYRQHGGNAWSMQPGIVTAGFADRLRKELQHDALKLRALQVAARKAGREVLPGAQLRDHQHLAARLASLRLAPERHPYRDDSRAALALRGAASSRAALTSWKRRGVLATWFLSVGLLPRPLATRAVLWRFVGGSRPVAVDRVLKAVRRWVR